MTELMEIGKTYYVKWWNEDRGLYWQSIFECLNVHPIYGTAFNRKYAYTVSTLWAKDPTSSGEWTSYFVTKGGTLLLGSNIANCLEVVPFKKSSSAVELPDEWIVA